MHRLVLAVAVAVGDGVPLRVGVALAVADAVDVRVPLCVRDGDVVPVTVRVPVGEPVGDVDGVPL